MKQIDWTKWSAIAEILSAIAIVATLAYLADQTQILAEQTEQNTQALEIGAYQDLMSQISQINVLVLENPEAFVWLQENRESSIPASDRDENYRAARAVVRIMIRHGDMAFHLFDRDAINQERFDSAIAPLRASICSPF